MDGRAHSPGGDGLVGYSMKSEEPSVHSHHVTPGAVHAGGTPVFDALAAQWLAAGRTVPGLPDPEWQALMGSRSEQRRRNPPRWVPQQRL